MQEPVDRNGNQVRLNDRVRVDEYPGETFEVVGLWSNDGVLMLELGATDKTMFDYPANETELAP